MDWISIEKRVPPQLEYVMIVCQPPHINPELAHPLVMCGWIGEDSKWYTHSQTGDIHDMVVNVSHWGILPEPPR